MALVKKNLRDELEIFFTKYPAEIPVHIDDEYRSGLEVICNTLLHSEISFINSPFESHTIEVLSSVIDIIEQLNETDILHPLTHTDFLLYMKLCHLFENLKFVFVSEILITNTNKSTFEFNSLLYNDELEQRICDIYKSKIEHLKSVCNKKKLQKINEEFTYFLLALVKFLLIPNLTEEENSLNESIDLLLKVADNKILIEIIHLFAHFIPTSMKISIMENITIYCIKKNVNIKDCGFIKSIMFKDFKLKILIMSYFTLQNICKCLKLQNLNQTFKLFSELDIQDIISFIESNSATPNLKFERAYEIPDDLISFKTFKKIKVVPSQEIKKCVNNLQILLDSLRWSLNDISLNCPFVEIILSMLAEFVMATDLDKPATISIIDLLIGYMDICVLPSKFAAVSYVFKIYQKLKSDIDLKLKSIELIKSFSKKMDLLGVKPNLTDLERFINSEDNLIDRIIIVSQLLGGINLESVPNDKIWTNLYYTLNEHIILSSHNIPAKELYFPYSVALNNSLKFNNEDCLLNNLAVLNDYTSITFENDESIPMSDKKYLITTILKHYNNISQCLPDTFLIKCWEYVLNQITMDLNIAKSILLLCESTTLLTCIDILKTSTIKIIESKEPIVSDDYYLHIYQLWLCMLKMQFVDKKKIKVRKDQVHHFCFILNKTVLFNAKKVQMEQSLILLLKLVSSLLKLSWMYKNMLMNCALRIITFVEKRTDISKAILLSEAAELLIVLYKCPNNAIKQNLGLYLISFTNIFNKCWSFIKDSIETEKKLNSPFYFPFHKLEKCSKLFRPNKSDFDFIGRCILEDIIGMIASRSHLPEEFMRYCYNIVFNLMDICETEDITQLIICIKGPALQVLTNAYREYKAKIRFTGRL